MDATITGTIKSRPQPASSEPQEQRITFLLFRDREWDEVACTSSFQFDGGIKPGLGDKVTLLGAWVSDGSDGRVAGFLFGKVEMLKSRQR
jgi:hypothetical protein